MLLAFLAAEAMTISSTPPADQPLVDLKLLIGKQVTVGRMPLCSPGTYSPDLAHLGKQATVVDFRPNTKINPAALSLNRLPPLLRSQMIDAARGGRVIFKFDDGQTLDTCADLMQSQIVDGVTLAKGDSIASLAAQRKEPEQHIAEQMCPVIIIKASSSGANFGHMLVDNMVNSEFQRQLDQTMHGGVGKHYLDVAARNASEKPIVGLEFSAVYQNKLGDEVGSTSFIPQNARAIAPSAEVKSSIMDRNLAAQSGVGGVKVYVLRVKFQSGESWADNGSHSCSLEGTVKL